MPLITFAGRPCTGKTTYAQKLATELRRRGHTVHVINAESEGIDKVAGYASATAEKMTRAALKSAAVRVITQRTFIIFDALNYFKSIRYEMFRFAAEQGTNSCVVWVDAPKEHAQLWNKGRDNGYTDELFEDLWGRFEVPNARARWDAPLFRPLGSNDDATQEPGHGYAYGYRMPVKRRTTGQPSSFRRVTKPSPTAPGNDGAIGNEESGTVSRVDGGEGGAGAGASSDAGAGAGAGAGARAGAGAGAGAGVGTGAGDSVGADLADDGGTGTSVSNDAVSGNNADGATGKDDSGEASAISTNYDEIVGLPVTDILAALLDNTQDKPINHATLKKPLADTNLLHMVDKVTQEVVAALSKALRLAMVGDSVVVPKCSIKVDLVRKPTVAELRRLRRQYLKLTRNHPPSSGSSTTALGDAFVRYINGALAGS